MIKHLAILLLILPLTAKESAPVEVTDFVRVKETKEKVELQTSNTTYVKGDQRVTLIGAVHVADESYYDELNMLFKKYDRVLYEMVGGENIVSWIKQREQLKKSNKKGNRGVHALGKAYGRAAEFLNLAEQIDGIDYFAKNMVHADLTHPEFSKLQKERGESIKGFEKESNQKRVEEQREKSAKESEKKTKSKSEDIADNLKKDLTGDANKVKRRFMDNLGTMDDHIRSLKTESVVITDRNAKCLRVLAEQFKNKHLNCAIFFGSAHFPSMEKSLFDLGFEKKEQSWMTAWNLSN